MRYRVLTILLGGSLCASIAIADEQQIPVGVGLQSSVVVSTGANGFCETTVAVGDIQAAPVGSPEQHLTEVRCGANKTVDTVAAGDDVQLIVAGGTCKNANTAIIDTGDNGIPESTPVGDDTYAAGMVIGIAPANRACVIAGADGIGQTAIVSGDDNLLIIPGNAAPNTGVVLCGADGVVDTPANNAAAGDDNQVVGVGLSCTEGDVIVDSGADGIAATLAVGPDLLIKAVNRVRVNIPSGRASASKTVHLTIINNELGAMAPASRAFRITTTNSTCPNGSVTQIDANAVTPGLQATNTVPLGGTARASLVVTTKLQNITTVASNAPFRCSFEVNVIALDTDPQVDDGANPEGNTTVVEVESLDRNDL